MQHSVAIFGGGVAGLSAAHELAERGFQVRVYERKPVPAMYLFILNLGGLTLGPLLPGVFNDYLFQDEKMIGSSVALTTAGAAVLMLVLFRATLRPYRSHYQLAQSQAGAPVT